MRNRLLVVDDSAVECELVRQLVTSSRDWDIVTADGVNSAVSILKGHRVDTVLTDLKMPGGSGLDLIEAAAEVSPSTAVIVMTSRGNESLAAECLMRGALGYIPKRSLQSMVLPTLDRIWNSRSRASAVAAALEYVESEEIRLSLPTDLSLIPPAMEFIEHRCRRYLKSEMQRVILAIEEATRNSMIHGNLEIGSALRGVDDEAYSKLLAQRQTTAKYRNRTVCLEFCITPTDEFWIRIADEGQGFDVAQLPDPTDPQNLLKSSGRGVMLMHAFMDDVKFNRMGNVVEMRKHRIGVESMTNSVLA